MGERRAADGAVGGAAVERAAVELDVTELVDRGLAAADPLRHLQLAAAVGGAADAAPMLAATALARHSSHDPVPLLDDVAFRATLRAGSGVQPTTALWAIWNLRRTQARVGTMVRGEGASELAVAAAMLDAVHALLSAHVYGQVGDQVTRRDCLDRTIELHASAGRILEGFTGNAGD